MSHLFYSSSFGLKESFIPDPPFCFTSGFVQSPSQHNVRVGTHGEEGGWGELDVTFIQLYFVTQTGPECGAASGRKEAGLKFKFSLANKHRRTVTISTLTRLKLAFHTSRCNSPRLHYNYS